MKAHSGTDSNYSIWKQIWLWFTYNIFLCVKTFDSFSAIVVSFTRYIFQILNKHLVTFTALEVTFDNILCDLINMHWYRSDWYVGIYCGYRYIFGNLFNLNSAWKYVLVQYTCKYRLSYISAIDGNIENGWYVCCALNQTKRIIVNYLCQVRANTR